MDDKIYNVTVVWQSDPECGEEYPQYEQLEDNNGKIIYCVRNLSDCPEDAIIIRDLCSAYEIIDYIQLGMKLAQEGYTSIQVTDEHVDYM